MQEMKVDKSQWGAGPWQDEPDRVEFEHVGLPCLIVRQPNMGHLCGYVAVRSGHPWHGKKFDDVPAEVHGGLTYGAKCQGNICHVPKPGEPDDVFWLGFDCAHAWDASPGTSATLRRLGHDGFRDDGLSYKTVEFVRAECQRLAEQARAAG